MEILVVNIKNASYVHFIPTSQNRNSWWQQIAFFSAAFKTCGLVVADWVPNIKKFTRQQYIIWRLSIMKVMKPIPEVRGRVARGEMSHFFSFQPGSLNLPMHGKLWLHYFQESGMDYLMWYTIWVQCTNWRGKIGLIAPRLWLILPQARGQFEPLP